MKEVRAERKPFSPMRDIAVRLLTKYSSSSAPAGHFRENQAACVGKLPWRWIAECTFAWMNAARRLVKELGISVSIEEAMMIIACAAVLLRRL